MSLVVLSTYLIALGAFVGALWPSLKLSLRGAAPSLADAVMKVMAGADPTTAGGWVNVSFVALIAPGAVTVAAVAAGIDGLTRTGPASVAAHAVAAWVCAGIVSVGVWIGLWTATLVGGLGLGAVGVLGAAVHVFAVSVLLASVGIAVGSVTGARRPALTAVAGAATLALVLHAVVVLTSASDALVRLGPWHYFVSGDPLTNGADIGQVAVLLGASLVVVAGTIFTARRRVVAAD